MNKIAWAKNGFTLIELLVVIAVLGVLAAGVLVAINPLKRINQANDSKIKSDIGQIANAMQAYYVTNQKYPANLQALKDSGDLKTIPTKPDGGAYEIKPPDGCADPCTEVIVSAPLSAPQTTGGNYTWSSATGQAGEIIPPTPTVTAAPPTNTPTPTPNTLAIGLVAYWKMNDNWQDAQGTNHGTSNGATFDTGNFGFGKAGSFNGSTSYVSGNIPSSTFSGNWTITAWFKHTQAGTPWEAIFSNNVNTNSAPVMTFRGTDENNNTNVTNQFGINNAGVSPSGVFVDLGADHFGKWIFGAITRQGNNVTVYAYKSVTPLQQSGSLSWLLTTSGGFYIGRHYTGGMQVFNGLIDEIRIYNRALSQTEVSNLYNYVPSP